MKIAALVLIALGILGLLYGGIHYTSRETIVDLGPVHATVNREHTLPIAPLAGILLLAIGTVALVSSRRTS